MPLRCFSLRLTHYAVTPFTNTRVRQWSSTDYHWQQYAALTCKTVNPSNGGQTGIQEKAF